MENVKELLAAELDLRTTSINRESLKRYLPAIAAMIEEEGVEIGDIGAMCAIVGLLVAKGYG